MSVNSEYRLANRIKRLLDRYSQADIARKTGFSPANVSRYLAGRKVPADFLEALVTECQVNPSWILTGQGELWLDQISSTTATLGDNLIDLVNGMHSLTESRLGNLVDAETNVFEELSNSLKQLEISRGKLRRQTKGLAEDLIKELWEVCNTNNRERAEGVRNKLNQAIRLSDDEDILDANDRVQAFYESCFGDMSRSIDLQKKLLVKDLLGNSQQSNKEALVTSKNLVFALAGLHRDAEAHRLSRVALVSLEDTQGTEEYHMVGFMRGLLASRLGNMEEGLKYCHMNFPHLDEFHDYARGYLFSTMLVNESLTAPEMLSLLKSCSKGTRAVTLLTLINLPTTEANRPILVRACQQMVKDANVITNYSEMRPRMLLNALSGNTEPVVEVAESFREKLFADSRAPSEAISNNALLIYISQSLEIVGQHEMSWHYLNRASELMKALPNQFNIAPLQRSIYFQTAERLSQSGIDVPGRLVQKGQQFFKDYYDKGFGCYRELVRTAD